MDTLYVKTLVQTILNKSFSAENRRNIVTYDNRFNFCCPVCGDSARSASKKRGNVFFDKLFFKCFNCGYTSSLNALCKKFQIQMDPAKRLEMIEYLSNAVNNSDYKSDMSELNLDELLNLSDLDELFNSLNSKMVGSYIIANCNEPILSVDLIVTGIVTS